MADRPTDHTKQQMAALRTRKRIETDLETLVTVQTPAGRERIRTLVVEYNRVVETTYDEDVKIVVYGDDFSELMACQYVTTDENGEDGKCGRTTVDMIGCNSEHKNENESYPKHLFCLNHVFDLVSDDFGRHVQCPGDHEPEDAAVIGYVQPYYELLNQTQRLLLNAGVYRGEEWDLYVPLLDGDEHDCDVTNHITYRRIDKRKNEYKDRYNEQVAELEEKEAKLEEANAKMESLATTAELKEFQLLEVTNAKNRFQELNESSECGRLEAEKLLEKARKEKDEATKRVAELEKANGILRRREAEVRQTFSGTTPAATPTS